MGQYYLVCCPQKEQFFTVAYANKEIEIVTSTISGKILLYLLVRSDEHGGGAIYDYKGDDPETFKGSWYGYSIMAPGEYRKDKRYDKARFLYTDITLDVLFEMAKCPHVFTLDELEYLCDVYCGDDFKQLRQMFHIRHSYEVKEVTA